MEQTSKTPWGTTEGLYDPSFEHDNCGIGAIVNIKGTILQPSTVTPSFFAIISNIFIDIRRSVSF